MGRFVPAAKFVVTAQLAVRPQLIAAAKEVVKVARKTASRDTGFYADGSLKVTVDGRGVVAETIDFAGHIIEYGSIGQPPQAPLRTGAAAVGRFDPA